ncbi:MAG: serine/threonine protein kinase [Treponema sp.]|nr:serine/threonine protein kinase [Treponema sp.]
MNTIGIGGAQTFSGGLLNVNEAVHGWRIESKIPVDSGEAEIYIAQKDKEKVALKYYRDKKQPKAGLLDKIKGLNNPHIVTVFDYGMYKDRFYVVMEYAAGDSLATKRDAKEGGGYKYLPLKEEDVLRICGEIVEAFKACHDVGIIHRDIKPANIFLRDASTREALVGDFGISSIMEKAGENSVHKTETVALTTGYAAPEVYSGIITPKVDYYALGITLWELATGKNPFLLNDGKDRNEAHLIRDTLEGRLADDIVSKEPILNERMQHLIRGLLAIDPNLRWGYDEVKRHLRGEFVEIPKNPPKAWSFTIGGVKCISLEEIADVIEKDFASCRKEIFLHHYLDGFLQDKYPDIAEKIRKAIEEAATKKNDEIAHALIVWALKPDAPLVVPNGFKATNIDDVYRLTIHAPETMFQMYKDFNSRLYVYLRLIGAEDKIPAIQNVIEHNDLDEDGCLFAMYEIAVILHDYRIVPFKQAEYKDIEMFSLEQLANIPAELRDYILLLIKEKSCDDFIVPWIMALAERDKKRLSLDAISTWADVKKVLK